VAIGLAAGAYIARDFTAMIARVYQYPELLFRVRWDVAALAAGAALLAAVVGAVGAVSRAVRLPPAEAMRPEPPASYRPTLVERLGLGPYLPNVARMVLRHLGRQPRKTAFSVLAIGLSVGIVVVGTFMQDTIDTLMDVQFGRVQRYDMMVSTVEPLSADLRYAIASVAGVQHVEPFRSVPARLRMNQRSRRVALLGLTPESDLYNIVDKRGQVQQPPEHGVVLSTKLAEILGLTVGDSVRAEVLEGKRPTLELPVVATIDDLQGLNAYMNFDQLSRALGEGPRASGAYLRIDRQMRSQVYRELKQIPALAGVTVKDFAVESFESTIAQNLLKMRLFNLSFSIVIAVGVVYNSARIALSERSRELATLRVIGFTRGEISAILLGELGVMTLVAIPLGIGIGYGLSWMLVQFLDQEVFRFPFAISSQSFGLAVSVVLTAAIVSSLLVRRRLDHLDLVSVLKSRE
jgi:putative ABC transport system permease protein